jgi:uncharacterized protein (DUF305 family)
MLSFFGLLYFPLYSHPMGLSKGRSWVAVIAAGCVIAGCGGGDEKAEAPPPDEAVSIVQPGAPGTPSQKLTRDQAKAVDTAKPIAQDVEFMRGMIHHHRQALLMTGWAPQRASSRDVKLMAQRMASVQKGEIELSERWLSTRGFDAGHEHDGTSSSMPGMLTQAQLDKLEQADGRAFDRLFLRYMTRHHQGAITMVRDLIDDGGGLEVEVNTFARNIESDQEIEIQRMRQVLAKLS